jgi:HSP20 family protein
MSLLTTLIPSFARASARCGEADATEREATVKPVFTVNENAEGFTVVVQLPGVAKDGLELTAEAGRLRILGRRAWQRPAGWTALRRESADVPFELVLTHDWASDAGKIHAELADGVLRLTLPKPPAARPRKIAVA